LQITLFCENIHSESIAHTKRIVDIDKDELKRELIKFFAPGFGRPLPKTILLVSHKTSQRKNPHITFFQ
jgi:hypothetical protein